METIKVLRTNNSDGELKYLGAVFTATYEDLKDIEEGVTKAIYIEGKAYKDFTILEVISEAIDYLVVIEINIFKDEENPTALSSVN